MNNVNNQPINTIIYSYLWKKLLRIIHIYFIDYTDTSALMWGWGS